MSHTRAVLLTSNSKWLEWNSLKIHEYKEQKHIPSNIDALVLNDFSITLYRIMAGVYYRIFIWYVFSTYVGKYADKQ